MAELTGVQESLTLLHDAYVENRLRILVGAGPSIRSGFPSWAELETRLLSAFLEDKFKESDDTALQLLLPMLPPLSKGLHAELGQGATDLVWNSFKQKPRFFKMLGKALYEGRSLHTIPIQPVQRQIASMDLATLYTTNYDPLIEIAMSRVVDGVLPEADPRAWTKYSKCELDDLSKRHSARVVHHLHGLVEPDGKSSGTCIITEEHYFQLAIMGNEGAIANRFLKDAMDEDGVLLVVGMSLTDRNLKRILYEGKRLGKQRQVYAVLREEDELVQTYQQLRWDDLGVQFIWVEKFDEIESLLRQVKFGPYQKGKPPEWVKRSVAWLEDRHITHDIIFSDNWQDKAARVLESLKSEIALRFPLSFGEDINIHLLLPTYKLEGEGTLHLVARTGGQIPSGAQAEERADSHNLAIRFLEEEGSSGAAFVSGRPDITADDIRKTHRNIAPEKILRWQESAGFRGWRSIVSIPMSDSEDWVPIAVVAVTSNSGNPFWESCGEKRDKYMSELKAITRSAVAAYILKDPHA